MRKPSEAEMETARVWAERRVNDSRFMAENAGAAALLYLLARERLLSAVVDAARPLAGAHRKKLTAALDALDAFDRDSEVSDAVQVAVYGIGAIACPLDVRPAMRRGPWAVTPFVDRDNKPVPGQWAVTHVPSGIKAHPGASDLRAARALCRRLHERLPDFGLRAKFGVLPRKMTGERWAMARETVWAWSIGHGR